MAKKAYSVPVLILGSGGIDITQSQEGSAGSGNVYDDIMGQLGESLDADALAWLTDRLGTDTSTWGQTVVGFDPSNRETWELVLEFVMTEYYGG